MNLRFFDSNCAFGNTTGPRLHYNRSEELLEIMDRNNIERAVVYNNDYQKALIANCNKDTINLVNGNERFVGAIVLVPTIFNENGTLESIRNSVKNGNIRFARMYPKTHNFRFAKWQMGDILDLLQEMRFPVIVNFEELDVHEFVETKKEYKDLPVILSCTTQWANRIYPSLCKELDNVFIETSNTIEYRGIEFLVNTLGEDAMIFGTNMPNKEPYDSIYNLVYADIPESAKERIAWGNINTLIEQIRM